MKSLKDQLAVLVPSNPTGHRARPGPAASPSSRGAGRDPQSIVLGLPLVGTVARVEPARGFGLVRSESGGQELFFHIRGRAGQRDHDAALPDSGTRMLFIVASNLRHGRSREAVRWRSLPDIPHLPESLTQVDLDALRREALNALDWPALWALLRADGYGIGWNGNAPSDLCDPVLESLLQDRIATLPPRQMEGCALWDRLARARYDFAARWTPDNLHRAFDLTRFSMRQLLALGAPRREWVALANHGLRMHLMEWHLLSRTADASAEDWSAWFTGTDAAEAELASRVMQSGLSIDPFVHDWLERLAGNALLTGSGLDAWLAINPHLALGQFDRLSPDRQAQQLTDWRARPETLPAGAAQAHHIRAVLTQQALTIDLESDGQRIWEVGCAQGEQGSLLHREGAVGETPDAALTGLLERAEAAAIVVGHNILAWDWPIIRRVTGTSATPLIWDTLLAQWLIAPHAASHALGGDHHADGDALASAALFRAQLSHLPDDFVRRLLLGEFTDAADLLAAVAQALEGRVSYARSATEQLAQVAAQDRLLLLTPDQARAFDWVPGVAMISAGRGAVLPLDCRAIDPASLEQEMRAAAMPDAAAVVVLAVVRLAARQGISVRRNMIPAWLTDGDPALAQALDRACREPDGTGHLRIAPLPLDLDWWRDADPHAHALVGVLDTLVLKDAANDAPDEWRGLLRDWSMTSLTCVARRDGAMHWLMPDRASHVLDPRGGLRHFATLPLAEGAWHSVPANPGASVPRPVLATRRHSLLHPHAHDQAAYWQDVLRSCRDVARRWPDAPLILLVGSSESRRMIDLLEAGLAEIGLGEVRPTHRSRREHLRRAACRGHVIIDHIASWPVWRALAETADVTLQPVVEALPIEQWHGCALTRPGLAAETPAPLPQFVRTADLLESLSSLLADHLPAWLASMQLGSAVVIDSRLASSGRAHADLFDIQPLPEQPLEPNQQARLDNLLSAFRLEREEAPSDVASMEHFLIRHWQADGGFKASQRAPMQAICDRASHVLVPLPTGEGKSVLFQVPALCRGLRNRRLTLVVSPLKALMRDQVEDLRDRGFILAADYLSSDLTPYEVAEVLQGVMDHRIVLLYVAPERLRSPDFLAVLEKRMKADQGLDQVVIDEAHCVNQWGYEFRPDYFYATQLLRRQCRVWQGSEATPFLLLSATVTASDRERLAAFLAGAPGDEHELSLLVRPETFAHPIRSHIAILPQRVVGGDPDTALAARLPVMIDVIGQALRNRAATGQRSAVIIFVQARALAHRLADQLADATGASIGCYHAGLDVGVREEVYSDFRLGYLDVLVATKAFGMGMDIPDIHWVVHASPPGYLEDYLQEVGRIGRGAAERDRAGLESLSAILPWAPPDFDHIRDLRARNALARPTIEAIHAEIRVHAINSKEGLVSVVPAHGYHRVDKDTERRAAATRMRMALYWLERADRLNLCASLRDVLTVTLHQQVLRSLVGEVGARGELAAMLLGLDIVAQGAREQNGADDAPARKNGLRQMLERLADRIGFAIRTREPGPATASTRVDTADSDALEAVINISQLRLQAISMPSPDAVLSTLVELERLGGLSLVREIEFSRRRLASHPEAEIALLVDLVDAAASMVIRQLEARGMFGFDPGQLVDLSPLREPPSLPEDADERARVEAGKLAERKAGAFDAAYVNGLRSLLRACDVKLRQVTTQDGALLWEATLAPSAGGKAMARRKAMIAGAKALLAVVRSAPQGSIAIGKLIDCVQTASADRRFDQRDLHRTAGLLSALKLVSIPVDILEMSHVVLLNEDAADEGDEQEVWADLAEINELAEARNLAMEVFVNLRPEAQEAFVAGYFACPDAARLKAFLETQLGEIEEEEEENDGGGRIAQMQERLRATRAVELFDFFRQSEEPAQWAVVQHPYDRHLLVNAGPGAGKTQVLVGRIAHLIREQHIHPEQIVVLAFNRAVVFEIRRRIRSLFRSLGYASYAARLRVSTIHGFALRHLGREGVQEQEEGLLNVLAEFARRMQADPAFRRTVAGDVRCILVDEFQDVTQDIYSILHDLYLGSGARAGVMVIGDDDQDIVRWNRKQGEFSERYFDRFVQDFGGDALSQLLLAVNFRSAAPIVERSQAMIAGFFHGKPHDRRLKTTSLGARRDASQEVVGQRFDWSGRLLEEAIDEVSAIRQSLDPSAGRTLAILCRSNADVAQAHRLLQPHIPGIHVQGSTNLRVASLRHQALWLEFLALEAAAGDVLLSDDLRARLLRDFRQATCLPEGDETGDIDGFMALWDLCCQERPFPHLSTLIRFTQELRSDDLLRLSGSRAGAAPIISTIHKVKGLEFDDVVILPSGTDFPLLGSATDLSGDAAEEARLLYVAMTRAKSGLWHFVGEREKSWGRRLPVRFAGGRTQSKLLVGSPEEVDLGWTSRINNFNPDAAACRAYIEGEVHISDPIILGGHGPFAGRSLMHRNRSGQVRQVGVIARKYGPGRADADLKVSAVIRFYPDLADRESATSRQWGYVVLVTGRLR